MKRLLRIAFNSAIFSFIPIFSWFCLGLLVDKNLANVFTLTYPLQFIWALLKSIFGTGANISKEKDISNPLRENEILRIINIRILKNTNKIISFFYCFNFFFVKSPRIVFAFASMQTKSWIHQDKQTVTY